ncbi:hypothetical protein GGR51DRAFT_527776 [Nemania sp. FL0031]|nr:hypothetical protein GGR51DRAFT_527776 [Nemania sp. FL0031]
MPPHNTGRADTTSEPNDPRQAHPLVVSKIHGRLIHPSKLQAMLQSRFGANYRAELFEDVYTITAGTKISYDDIKNCY